MLQVFMMSGHAYARALRAHLLSLVAIVSKLLAKSECPIYMDLPHLTAIHKALLNRECSISSVEKEECVNNFTDIIDNLMIQAVAQSRTGKLWIECRQSGVSSKQSVLEIGIYIWMQLVK